jgi:ribosome biogenesis GTPase / thiamine phosphate phosphatase
VRPGRGSRPRTKTRPAHASAVIGFVFAVDRGRYSCMVDGRSVVAMKARELGRGSVVVGDQVALAGDVTGSAGSLARIVRVLDRSSVLRRSADDSDPVERVIVANADQMLIVCALASPPPRLRFVDRCLVAAYDAGLSPVLVLTKADLGSSVEVRSVYGPLDMPMIDTRPGSLGALPSLLSDRISVLIGQSGVGKSTLVNALVPSAVRSVGSVNPVTGRGRHTSSSAVAFRYGDAGWLIDTPGLRGFGLGHVSAERVVEAFGDLAAGLDDCPPGCDHLSDGCGLDAAVASADANAGAAPGSGGADARLDSLRRLLASRSGAPDSDLAECAWVKADLGTAANCARAREPFQFTRPFQLMWRISTSWRVDGRIRQSTLHEVLELHVVAPTRSSHCATRGSGCDGGGSRGRRYRRGRRGVRRGGLGGVGRWRPRTRSRSREPTAPAAAPPAAAALEPPGRLG